jgi:hypothetical protein
VNEPLGLDSIAFDTFDWELVDDDASTRAWQGDGIVLAESFFDLPPNLASLELDALRAAYEATGDEGDRTRKIIDLTVTLRANRGHLPTVSARSLRCPGRAVRSH